MSRKSTIEPRWLVSMLTRWVQHDVGSWSGRLSFPKQAIFLLERVDGLRSTDDLSSSGYSPSDYDKITEYMEEFRQLAPDLWAAVTMYYKPWTVSSLTAVGHPHNPDKTYYRRLHEAHAYLAIPLWEIEKKYLLPVRDEVLEYSN